MNSNRAGTPIERTACLPAESRPAVVGHVRAQLAGGRSDRGKADATSFEPEPFPSGLFGRRAGDVRFFVVHGLRDHPGRRGDLPPIRVQTPTLKNCLALRLMRHDLIGRWQVAAIRRKIALAKEAARDRCRSAIDRTIALARLELLSGLAAVMSAEAIDTIEAEPLPRVLSAGGQAGAFAPLT